MGTENSPPQFRKTKNRRAKKPLHLLPQELIEEILSKLPVKSLLRFRCVSKSWRSSIGSRFFINKGLRNSTQRRAISPNDDPNNYHLMTGSAVVGCCNGLFCILKDKSFFLWNPSIRFSIELPKIDLQMTKYGFGWDEETDAYKVFALVSQQDQNQNQNQCMGKVYSSRKNSWKTVEHGCLSLYKSLGVFVCGKIHWLAKTGREIESFDLKSEVFGMMEGPCDWGLRTWVKERDGCLSVLCDYNRTRLDSWVMKKYGVKESWVLQNTAPIPPEYKFSHWCTLNLHDKGMTFWPAHKKTVNFYTESLVSPVWNSRQDEIEAICVAEGRPKHQIKRRPARQNKRKAAGCGVELTQESKEIVQEKAHTSVVEGRPKRQNKKRAVRYGVEGTKENQEMEQEQVHTSVVVGRPKRQDRRRPARYGDQGVKENPEIEKEQVRATCVNEGLPKRQSKRKEMEQEQVHTREGVAEGRPKRLNRRRPARYDN